MKYLSVCSGMEAASVAWHPLGWTPVGFSEIEPFPCAILKHRFPNTPNYGDLTQYQQWPLSIGDVDLIAGGPPCQAFSVAGLRRGLADPRGNLTLTYLGLVDKLRPKWVVYENVPGLLSVDGGRAFGAFLGALGELGYSAAWRVLDAQYVGRCEMHTQDGEGPVPQRRRRIFLVAHLGDWRPAAEVLSLPEGLSGYLETGNKKRKGVASDAGASVEASGLPIWRAGDQANAEHMIDHAGTVNCNKGSHGGFIAQPISHWEGGNIHPTLNNFDLGDTRTTHAVVEPIHQMPGSVAPTIGASGPPYSRTGNERVEAEALAVTTSSPLHFDTYNQTTSDISFTLSCSASDANHTGTVFVPNMAVRRLTPNECYRLQGFPDNWGNIPWKGKPEGQAPDGPQYKAAGNSMAVPVMRWIGERIAEVDAKYSCNKTEG